MRTPRLLICVILLSLLGVFPAACATQKKMTVGATALLLEDIAKSANKQSDTRVIREGMPAYLLLMDGMVEAWPDNERLLIAAAQGYATFASAFVEVEDKAYASLLYERAKDYALRSMQQIGLKNPASMAFDDFEASLNGFDKQDVPYMFWAAMCWGNWIRLNMGSMEALAELPRVVLLMKKVLELDEKFYYGGAHLFMGVWYASRPKMAGGDLNAAQAHFLKAIELGQGRFLMANIYYAKHYAKKALDKQLYISLLEKVLQTPADSVPELTLLNSVAHDKAKKMIAEADQYFYKEKKSR